MTLDPHDYPMFVRFRDPKDPKSVEDATDIEKDGMYSARYGLIGEMFGAGVRLKDISIEVTSEPVTNTISRYLPSFGPETGFMKWFNKLPFSDARRIGPYDFKVGGK